MLQVLALWHLVQPTDRFLAWMGDGIAYRTSIFLSGCRSSSCWRPISSGQRIGWHALGAARVLRVLRPLRVFVGFRHRACLGTDVDWSIDPGARPRDSDHPYRLRKCREQSREEAPSRSHGDWRRHPLLKRGVSRCANRWTVGLSRLAENRAHQQTAAHRVQVGLFREEDCLRTQQSPAAALPAPSSSAGLAGIQRSRLSSRFITLPRH